MGVLQPASSTRGCIPLHDVWSEGEGVGLDQQCMLSQTDQRALHPCTPRQLTALWHALQQCSSLQRKHKRGGGSTGSATGTGCCVCAGQWLRRTTCACIKQLRAPGLRSWGLFTLLALAASSAGGCVAALMCCAQPQCMSQY